MSSFIRPELKDAMWRGREVIAALVLAGFGLWLGLVSFGIMEWIGWGMFGLGSALTVTSAQKLQFRGDGEGAGVVTLDERRVTYLGPHNGGVADLDLMVQLDLTPRSEWRLINDDGSYLDIPTNALGVEALFDVFTALPGLKTEYMLSVLNRRRRGQMTVWMAPDHTPYTLVH